MKSNGLFCEHNWRLSGHKNGERRLKTGAQTLVIKHYKFYALRSITVALKRKIRRTNLLVHLHSERHL